MHNELYLKILHEIDTLLFSLRSNVYEGDNRKIKQQAINDLEKHRDLLEKDLISLKTNSDWEKFNIAFYGETNAGKSTLIETLRILLAEPKKMEQRNAYSSTAQAREKLVMELDAITKELEELETSKNVISVETEAKRHILDNQIEAIEDKWILEQLLVWEFNRQVLLIMASGVSGFIKVLFKKTDEQQQAMQHNKEVEELVKVHSSARQSLLDLDKENERLTNESFEKAVDLRQQQERILKTISCYDQSLRELSDGKIIGAQTDFTREVTSYEFSANNTNFAILDLPGIEGKEEFVQDEIKKAVEKAHCVLYISRKAKAPQKGDGEHKGTIEKIAEHLKGQSEVYFIFNKSIKNSIQLENDLETEDITVGLAEVDTRMRSVISDNYLGHKTVSAYPAFVSISNSFGDSYEKSKNKLLKDYSIEEILSKSGMKPFQEWVVNDLIQNHKNKIINSNIKKIKIVNHDILESIIIYKSEFIKLKNEILNDIHSVEDQLMEQISTLNSAIENILRSNERAFINSSRKEIYQIIDKGIDNKHLTIDFKNLLQRNEKEFEDNIQKEIDDVLETFKEDVIKIIDGHCKYVDELMNIHSKEAKIKFDYSFNISAKSKSNIIKALIPIAIFIVTFVLSPEHNMIPLIASGITALVSFAKEIYGLFDKGYKIEQQKRSINERLLKMSNELDKTVEQMIVEINREVSSMISPIKEEIHTTEDKISLTIQAFQLAQNTIEEQVIWLEGKEKELYGNN